MTKLDETRNRRTKASQGLQFLNSRYRYQWVPDNVMCDDVKPGL